MKADDLKGLNIFSIDEKTGFPLLESNRVFIIGQTGLERMRSDLLDSLDCERMAAIFFRYGYETGISLSIVVREHYRLDSPEEYVRACGVLMAMAGAADVEFHDIQLDAEGRLIRCTGVWQNSIEALLARADARENPHPACAILEGMMSGYLSAFMEMEILFRETACRGRLDDHCAFEGKPLADWGTGIERARRSDALGNLTEEMVRLQSALQNAREQMEQQAIEIRDLKKRIGIRADAGIVYRSSAFSRNLTLAAKVAPTRTTVLLQGESGTGKEIVARFIHDHSEFPQEPFLAVNCAALPAHLLESELFGYKKGAFTGAESDKKGLFLQAAKGTLLLDEIGEMPPELQAKLLRAIEQKEVRPVGGLHDLPMQARIIAATNRDLKSMVADGRFREDLFFRLSVFPITIAPLRERKEDILPLARHFLFRMNPDHPGFSAKAARVLEIYDWPGNVRELENWVEYALILAPGRRIGQEHLPLTDDQKKKDLLFLLSKDMPTCRELENRYIHHVLEHTRNNQAETARILGIGVSTLWRRQKNLNSGGK